MPRINSLLRLLHNNSLQVIPVAPKALVVMQPVHKAVLAPKPADPATMYFEYKNFAAGNERQDMPRPDALAIALLEQYPNHS